MVQCISGADELVDHQLVEAFHLEVVFTLLQIEEVELVFADELVFGDFLAADLGDDAWLGRDPCG